MNRNAPRSIDQYLRQLREELAGARFRAHSRCSVRRGGIPARGSGGPSGQIRIRCARADRLHLRRARRSRRAYRDTEAKVKAAMATPRKEANVPARPILRCVPGPPRLYLLVLHAVGARHRHHLFHAGGHRAFAVGAAFGAGHWRAFLSDVHGVCRVVSLAEGRLIEAMTGVRMPRRPVYQSKALKFWERIGEMLKDPRTWTTIAYFILMLPIGILYFVTALVGLFEPARSSRRPSSGFLRTRVGLAWEPSTIFSTSQPEWYSTSPVGAAASGIGRRFVADLADASGARRRAPACAVRQIHAGRTTAASGANAVAHDSRPRAH